MIGDDRGNFVIGKRLREGRHAIRHRIARRTGRKTAVEHHADRIDRRFHLDRLIARQRRIARRLSRALGAVAVRTLGVVYRSCPGRTSRLLSATGTEVSCRFRRCPLGETLQIHRHGADILVRQVLQAVVDHLRHGAIDGAAMRDAITQVIGDIRDAPIA